MKVGFVGRWSALEKTAWSGIYFHTYQAIKKYYDTEIIYFKWPWYIREKLLLHKQYQQLINKKAAVEFLKSYAQYFSRQLEKELYKKKVDLLFVPSAPQLVAYCKTDIPIIYMTDATFYQLQGYYPTFNNIAGYNINQGIDIDKNCFKNSTHCMVASTWVKQSAMLDYGIAENKISVVPFGANIDRIPLRNELKNKKNKVCQLLFLGVEWERKGGQVALDTFFSLQKSGVPVQLTIVGCIPPVSITAENIKVIPFINKNNPDESERLYQLLLKSDFLLLPTKAECAGVVFCEAGAFGLPSITADTGGVNDYIQDGINGFTLSPDAGAGAYADKIKDLFYDDAAYHQLCLGSRMKYENELNWDTWGKSFCNIAEKAVKL